MTEETKSKAQLLRELEEANEKYHTLFEYTGDSIFIIEVGSMRIMDANTNAARRLGYSREELLAMTLNEIDVTDTVEGSGDTVLWQSVVSGTIVSECVYRHKSGSHIPVEVSSRLIGSGQGLIINTARDLTARKEAERTLKQTHERLEALRRVDDELTRRLNLHYVLTMALDTATRLSGASAGFIGLLEGETIRVAGSVGPYPHAFDGSVFPISEGIVGRTIREQAAEYVPDVTVDPDYIPVIANTCATVTIPLISQRRFVGILNLEARRPDAFVPDSLSFLKQIAARAAVALDNARMFEERAQLVSELEAFSHTVAHDLKNPLAGIIGFAQLLAHHYPTMPEAEARDYLAEILAVSKKMNTIIDELLLLSSVRKLEDVPIKPLDMAAIVEEAQLRLFVLIDAARAEIHEPAAWPTALGYAPWIEEVWANYLSNAIKYGSRAGEPPRVALGAEMQPDGMVRFWVQDHGPGIAPEDQARLFRQFTRLDAARAQGDGLGLSIVQRIVHKLKGTVGVESAPGQGSRFYFALPAPGA